MPEALLLRDQFGHMGAHSGYDRLANALDTPETGWRCASLYRAYDVPGRAVLRRLARPLTRRIGLTPFYDVFGLILELQARRRMRRGGCGLVHVMYAENDLGILTSRRPGDPPVVATAHLPARWWRERETAVSRLSGLSRLITVSGVEAAYFEEWLPGRVRFVPHGVDTDFFRPGVGEKPETPFRCVFAGVHMRDVDTLATVVEQTAVNRPNIQFDLIVPERHRHAPAFARLDRPSVHWRANLSDEELRNVYQNAHLLLMPLKDATANNALLEAMACGLPVIVTDLPAVRDYTLPTFAHLTPPGDADAMVSELLAWSADLAALAAAGRAAREHAVASLSWPMIAERVIGVYTEA